MQRMNNDSISRSALKKKIEEVQYTQEFCIEHQIDYSVSVHMLGMVIDNAPTVKTFTLEDIEEQYRKGLEKGLSEWETERPTGHWVNGYKSFNCSVCGKIAYSWNHFGEYIQVKSNFCPHCGADMRGEE